MNFMLLVARAISHSFAALTREILFLPLEHKIHNFLPPCNILSLYIFFSAAYPYEHTSSHFAAFFLTSIVMVFAAYVVYHNRQKVMLCRYYSSSVPQSKPIYGRYKVKAGVHPNASEI